MTDNWHIKNDSFFTKIEGKEDLIKELDSLTNKAIHESVPKGIKRQIHTSAAAIYSYFPEKTRLLISSTIKNLQGKTSPDKKQQLLDSFLKLTPDVITQEVGKEVLPITKTLKKTILLTHDVDYVNCYKFLLKLAEYENKNGACCAYYFLTNAEYKIEKSVLSTLREMGHEIGLHGNRYDLRLAYRKLPTVIKNISYGKNYIEDLLGEEIYGFRNHSLILSSNILQGILQLGFKYDSGIYPRARTSQLSSWFAWPFQYQGKPLWEIPVTWPQDADAFRKYNFSEKQALELYLSTLDETSKINGLSCFNFHPFIVENKYSFYTKFLSEIKNRNFKFETPLSIINAAEAAY